MKIQIHYWPEAPNQRQIKIYCNNELQLEYFLGYNEILEMVKRLNCALDELSDHQSIKINKKRCPLCGCDFAPIFHCHLTDRFIIDCSDRSCGYSQSFPNRGKK